MGPCTPTQPGPFLLKTHHLTTPWTVAVAASFLGLRPCLWSGDSGKFNKDQNELGGARSRGPDCRQHSGLRLLSTPLGMGKGHPCPSNLWPGCYCPKRATPAPEDAEGHPAAWSPNSRGWPDATPAHVGRNRGRDVQARDDPEGCCLRLGTHGSVCSSPQHSLH